MMNKALEDLADASLGEVPKYKAIHGMLTHIYAIDTYLKSTYGANKCPLRYLTMSNDLLVDVRQRSAQLVPESYTG